MFKNSLVVNTYQSKTYIWIKRYFYDLERKLWLACRGNFRFSPELDNFDGILDFLKEHVELIKKKNKKNNNNPPQPPQPTAQFQLDLGNHDDATAAAAEATDDQKNEIEKE